MRRLAALLPLASLAVSTTGCYHTQVTTGRPAGTTVVDKPWAMSFVYGLVAPKAVDAAAACPGGTAMVETEISFLNGLVSGITFGLVTPMHITVTCASGTTGALDAPHGDVRAEAGVPVAETIREAAALAARTEQPILVHFAD